MTAGNGVEVGAGWNKVSNDGGPFISVKLDDPSFVLITAARFGRARRKSEYALIWESPKAGGLRCRNELPPRRELFRDAKESRAQASRKAC
ncbi:DUF736 family protein [Agrobacterium tumefaciens]|uniref:DUF736 family protein n=1 Tax=Agrobacterium tumefaciens TaxID=358 RepID=UPI003977A216